MFVQNGMLSLIPHKYIRMLLENFISTNHNPQRQWEGGHQPRDINTFLENSFEYYWQIQTRKQQTQNDLEGVPVEVANKETQADARDKQDFRMLGFGATSVSSKTWT